MDFFRKIEYKILLAISTILALNSYFFIERKSTNDFPLIFDNIKVHYLIYILCVGGIIWVWWKVLRNEHLTDLVKKFLLTFLPAEIVFILGLFITHSETKVHFVFYLLTGLYLVTSAIFFIETRNKFNAPESFSREKTAHWFKKQGLATFFILFISLSTFGYFTINKIENYAGVDEPLWTLDRIPFFWKNVAEMDWKNTSVSDKPGITVVLISGLGLFDNPVKYYYDKEEATGSFVAQKDIRTINKDFRLPLAIFCLISLLIFYIFIQKLLGRKTAALAIIFISTAPMLIGMSRIINPDAILWVFIPLTILAYLIFLKKKTRLWLYITGVLLGLAILTKYVANVLYIFFFALIFLEYLFTKKDERPLISKYLKESFTHFASIVLVSLITFYLLFPETWVDLKKLFTGTILSQAFVSIAPIFIGIILFLAFDTLVLKNKISTPLFNFFFQKRAYLLNLIVGTFVFFGLFTLINTYLGMPWVNFEDILSSPKTSYRTHWIFSIFSTNFYPLVFASLPIVLMGLLFSLLYFFKNQARHNKKIKIIFYFLFFILLYYLGTTFNGVVSTIRYQVVLYPLLLILSALGIRQALKYLKYKYSFEIISILLLIIGFFTLYAIKPYYLGYASSLLPKNHIVDVKDMGDGSYQAAQYLNNLPDAKNLFIWTDKNGVCAFFVGECDSFYDLASFKNSQTIDYFVISSGRKNKILNETRGKSSLPYDFEKIYNSDKTEFNISIGNRKGNYVKILRAEDFKK